MLTLTNKSYLIIDNIKIPTKVALTQAEQARGLMFQKNPPVMTFLYPDLDIRKFWMHNTPSDLAICFIKNNSIVDICHGKPFDESNVGPDIKTNKVIEFPLALAKELNISKETKISIHLDFDTFKKYCLIKY